MTVFSIFWALFGITLTGLSIACLCSDKPHIGALIGVPVGIGMSIQAYWGYQDYHYGEVGVHEYEHFRVLENDATRPLMIEAQRDGKLTPAEYSEIYRLHRTTEEAKEIEDAKHRFNSTEVRMQK